MPGYRRRAEFDDGASDISSASGFSAYGYNRSGENYPDPLNNVNKDVNLYLTVFCRNSVIPRASDEIESHDHSERHRVRRLPRRGEP